ncbi:hypothetical protein SAY87_016481 [Trapa incisa]|uniref:Uncharacterized protein n=1 Tax=Trapa incisa TaxID=236973 RepID=A0AAN7L8M1_9MYRT|nr:hypothetical protein SAY87_016481 [Trapa incisa]
MLHYAEPHLSLGLCEELVGTALLSAFREWILGPFSPCWLPRDVVFPSNQKACRKKTNLVVSCKNQHMILPHHHNLTVETGPGLVAISGSNDSSITCLCLLTLHHAYIPS